MPVHLSLCRSQSEVEIISLCDGPDIDCSFNFSVCHQKFHYLLFIVNLTCFIIIVCGGILTEPVGVIESSNITGSYGNNLNCTWLIKVKSGRTVALTFENFDLQNDSQCQNDYMQVCLLC